MTPAKNRGTTGESGGIRRRPGRTNRTQLRLFESAMVIMSEKGPTATTVEEVAAKAGVSKGTVKSTASRALDALQKIMGAQ